jgi:hypothetical protein
VARYFGPEGKGIDLGSAKKGFGGGANDWRVCAQLLPIVLSVDPDPVVKLESRTQTIESRTKIRGGRWNLNGCCHKGEP